MRNIRHCKRLQHVTSRRKRQFSQSRLRVFSRSCPWHDLPYLKKPGLLNIIHMISRLNWSYIGQRSSGKPLTRLELDQYCPIVHCSDGVISATLQDGKEVGYEKIALGMPFSNYQHDIKQDRHESRDCSRWSHSPIEYTLSCSSINMNTTYHQMTIGNIPSSASTHDISCFYLSELEAKQKQGQHHHRHQQHHTFCNSTQTVCILLLPHPHFSLHY